MSQVSNNKGKDVAKPKYATLNVNQSYKGTKKVENKNTGGEDFMTLESCLIPFEALEMP